MRRRLSARCWATRTAPGLAPTISAVSSADNPTTMRSTRISRCFSGSVSSRSRSCADSSPRSARCSGPAPVSTASGTSATGSDPPADRPVRVDHLVCGDPVDEREERLALHPVVGQCRQDGEAHLLCHVVRGEERAVDGPEPAAAVPGDQRADHLEQPRDGVPVARHRRSDQLVRDLRGRTALRGGIRCRRHSSGTSGVVRRDEREPPIDVHPARDPGHQVLVGLLHLAPVEVAPERDRPGVDGCLHIVHADLQHQRDVFGRQVVEGRREHVPLPVRKLHQAGQDGAVLRLLGEAERSRGDDLRARPPHAPDDE